MAFLERLKMVCGQIIPADFMADIGTNHAYVPIFAVKKTGDAVCTSIVAYQDKVLDKKVFNDMRFK